MCWNGLGDFEGDWTALEFFWPVVEHSILYYARVDRPSQDGQGWTHRAWEERAGLQ